MWFNLSSTVKSYKNNILFLLSVVLLKGIYIHQERCWRKSRGNDD